MSGKLWASIERDAACGVLTQEVQELVAQLSRTSRFAPFLPQGFLLSDGGGSQAGETGGILFA
jgi:hypothetical protein